MTNAIVLTQGDELVSGEIIDTNAQFLCEALSNHGISVVEIRTIPDNLSAISLVLQESLSKADIVISSGGLGPTEDDYSARSAAFAFNLPLEENAIAINQIKQHYQKTGKPFLPICKKMAFLPKGAELLANPIGSAPGFKLNEKGTTLYFFPGVPAELKPMFTQHFSALQDASLPLLHLGTLGLREAVLATRLAQYESPHLQIGYRATRRVNVVKLRFLTQQEQASKLPLIRKTLEDVLFGVGEVDLASVVGSFLARAQHTIALAESCTAGKISSWLAAIPGSSRYLIEGAVVYANEAKIRTCNVSQKDLEQFGAVSKPVAIQMAIGIRQRAKTTWGASVTGIAGPNGGSQAKPVGTVHIAVCGPDYIEHKLFRFSGTRDQITESSAAHALFMVFQGIKKARKSGL